MANPNTNSINSTTVTGINDVTDSPIAEFSNHLSQLSMTSPIRPLVFHDQILAGLFQQLDSISGSVIKCKSLIKQPTQNWKPLDMALLKAKVNSVTADLIQLQSEILNTETSFGNNDSGIGHDVSVNSVGSTPEDLICLGMSNKNVVHDDSKATQSQQTSIAIKNDSFSTEKSSDYTIDTILEKKESVEKPSTSAKYQVPEDVVSVDSESSTSKKPRTGKNQPSKCDLCDKEFRTSWCMTNHRRIHTGERPYVCTIEKCRKAFSDASNFRAHVKTHGEKNNTCPVCGRSFTLRSYFKKHQQSTACGRFLQRKSKELASIETKAPKVAAHKHKKSKGCAEVGPSSENWQAASPLNLSFGESNASIVDRISKLVPLAIDTIQLKWNTNNGSLNFYPQTTTTNINVKSRPFPQVTETTSLSLNMNNGSVNIPSQLSETHTNVNSNLVPQEIGVKLPLDNGRANLQASATYTNANSNITSRMVEADPQTRTSATLIDQKKSSIPSHGVSTTSANSGLIPPAFLTAPVINGNSLPGISNINPLGNFNPVSTFLPMIDPFGLNITSLQQGSSAAPFNSFNNPMNNISTNDFILTLLSYLTNNPQ